MEKRKGLCVFLLGGVVFSAGVAAVLFPAAAPYRAYSVGLGAALALAGAALLCAGRRMRRRMLEDPAHCPELAVGLREFAAGRTAAAARGATETMDAAALGRRRAVRSPPA